MMKNNYYNYKKLPLFVLFLFHLWPPQTTTTTLIFGFSFSSSSRVYYNNYYNHKEKSTTSLSPSPSSFLLSKSKSKSTALFVEKKKEGDSISSSSSNQSRKGGGGGGGGSNQKKKKKRKRRSNNNNKSTTIISSNSNDHQNEEEEQIWRIYGIKIHPDQLPSLTDDATDQTSQVYQLLQRELIKKLPSSSLSSSLSSSKKNQQQQKGDNYKFQVVRRSLDARKKLPNPIFTYIIDVTIPSSYITKGWKSQPGRLERMLQLPKKTTKTTATTTTSEKDQKEKQIKDSNNNNKATTTNSTTSNKKKKKRVIIVGAGPAGLFCALQLLQHNQQQQQQHDGGGGGGGGQAQDKLLEIILLDRGQPVEQRGRDIGALIHRRTLNQESNFAFGEGGAGTWSDGKLTTRIGRNSSLVRQVLELLVEFGAPSTILWEGSPHLGTDNLVRLLRNMRQYILEFGGGGGGKDNNGQQCGGGSSILFGTRMTDLVCEEQKIQQQGKQGEGEGETKTKTKIKGIKAVQSDGTTIEIYGDAVVLATGHSARDVYESLHNSNNPIQLEAKGFAVGFRIEHPQTLITDIQYGKEWGPSVSTGRGKTDAINAEYFTGRAAADEEVGTESSKRKTKERPHSGRLPVPSYRLATDKAEDGSNNADDDDDDASSSSTTTRGVYSFCMCPGGQIVPSSSDPNEVCVNGMSFSRRDSIWANSALVVTVSPDDVILQKYRSKYGVMAGVEFQKDMERRAAVMGGGNWTVPVQRVTDFVSGTISETVPPSSYRLGVKSAPCHEIYPKEITNALRDALINYFEKQMPGYYHHDALLHGVETRTSSPLRISRDRETLQATGTENLFPAGEGAGFAGGIVSAAVDGITVAEAVLDILYGPTRPGAMELEGKSKKSTIGFSY